ncbi:MAG: GTPase RsgA [Clostridiales bacterium]|jgi:ribosome biogenesis GTPase|nr:GTPase RsgA [Clostridiales bacterium]
MVNKYKRVDKLENLNKLGWSQHFQEGFEVYSNKGYIAGRVVAAYMHMYKASTEYGELSVEISGKLRFEASAAQDYPAIGDWVVISPRPEEMAGTIHGILPRSSKFSRTASDGTGDEQIIAANIDTVFIVNSLNSNFNLRRIERYLTLAWESGASPVIILSKADLCHDAEEKYNQVEEIAFGVPIHVVSSVSKEGLEGINQYLLEGKTVVLLGSSGVGKSTLVNELTGEHIQRVQDISRIEDKGRHTTTSRELITLKSGAMLIDTPGMRELHLWEGEDGIGEVFSDIEKIAEGCHFNDCTHEDEPGCAVKHAINEGLLDNARLVNYNKMQLEIKRFERKQARAKRMGEKKGKKNTGKNGVRNKRVDSFEY